MVHDGGIYHTKNNNNRDLRRVYLLQCSSQVPYHCVYKRMHLYIISYYIRQRMLCIHPRLFVCLLAGLFKKLWTDLNEI